MSEKRMLRKLLTWARNEQPWPPHELDPWYELSHDDDTGEAANDVMTARVIESALWSARALPRSPGSKPGEPR